MSVSTKRQPNIITATPMTHGEKYRETLKQKKPKVYEKIQDYLKNPNSKHRVCSIDIVYDWKCNMHCTHCFATVLHNEADSKKRFNPVKFKSVCDQADELGVFAIGIQGGEPLVWEELPQLLKAMQPERFNVSIVTNGFLLDNMKAEELLDLGIDRMCISIDSGIAEEHDKFRNYPGSFSKAIRGIEACIEVGLTPHIHTVVTHESLYSKGFDKIREYAEEMNLGISILIAVPAGNWRGEMDLLITDEDAEYIKKLHEVYPLLRRDITPVNNVDTGCRAVTYALYITGSGEVLPCPFLHFTLGNVFEEKLSSILAKGHRIREFSEYHSKCLAGEDREFIDKYMSKTFKCDKLPLKVEDVFDLI